MLKLLPLHEQVKSVQGTLEESFDAVTNMQAVKFIYGVGRTVDMNPAEVQNVMAAHEALRYHSLKRAFLKGVENAANDRAYRDSDVAATLRSYVQQEFEYLDMH